MPRKKVIRPGEKVGLRLTQPDRTLLLESLVLIPEEVEEAIRSSPPSGPLMLTLDDLDDLAGHVAAQANHAEEKKLQKALDRVYRKIETLLDTYTDREALTCEGRPNSLAEAVDQLRGHQGPVVFRMPLAPGKRPKCSIKMTPQQRESLVRCTGLKQSLRNKIGMVSEGTQVVEFTRKELDELYDEIGAAIVHAPSLDKRRLASIQDKISAFFEEEKLIAFGIKRVAAPRKPSKKSGLVYQLKVTLADIQPAIWRRVRVPDVTLGNLHEILQVVMGWQNSHLHQFVIDDCFYGPPTQGDFGPAAEDEDRVLLSQVTPKGGKKLRFLYEYDFGDGWNHVIEIADILSTGEGNHRPVCLDGAGACPPEDVGGPWGYGDFLKAMSDPKHADHSDMKEWIGGTFDPERFSVAAVNREFQTLR